MFHLHDSTRRWICVAAFLTLCVLPTVIVLVWGVSRRLPWYAQSEADRLGTHLGVKVALSAFSHPRPGVTVYEGLQLLDPETGCVLLDCRQLEAVRLEPDGRGEAGAGAVLTLTASQPVVDAAQLGRTWQLLERVLACRSGWPKVDVRAACDNLVMKSGNRRWTLVEPEAAIGSEATGARAEVAFRLAGIEMSNKARFSATRDSRSRQPRTIFAIDTDGAPLPCSFMAELVPQVAALGPESSFRGRCLVTDTPGGWEGEISGLFAHVDLAQLTSGRIGHRLDGVGQLTVESVVFSSGRLCRVAGSLHAGPGTMSRSLLDAASLWLGMIRNADQEIQGTALPYEQLAVSFAVDSDGMEIRGLCSGPGQQVVLTSRYGPLLLESPAQPLPAAALVGALAPSGEMLVPAASQTDWLLGCLPVSGAAKPIR